MGVCNCSMFCCTLLYVHSSIAIILIGKRELIALLNLSSWCLVMVERLFLALPRGCLQFVIVVFPDHTHYLYPPPHTLVSGYYVIPLGVCPSVRLSIRPCSPFPIDNLSIYSRNFFKFCIHIVIGDEWYGIVNGQNPSIFNGVTALFRIGKMVSGLLFLYCS